MSERTINELLAYFLTKSSVDKVVIYGSRAKGNYHNGSAIDFAIWTDDHDNFFRIAGELDDLPTPYKFDVTDYNTLSHADMKNSIDKFGILFYEKKSD